MPVGQGFQAGGFILSTAKSILISCGARLAPFDIKEVRDMMSQDELELDKLGGYWKTVSQKHIKDRENRGKPIPKDDIREINCDKTGKKITQIKVRRKTALFVIISDTDASFNFIVSLIYSQLFNILCSKADNEFRGRLPVHVRCLLDEFANIGIIPQFEKLIATIRSREISVSVILQAESQLKAIYKDNTDTIIGNCDTQLFLGGKEKTTLESISKMLGKETIDSFNTSKSGGSQKSNSTSYQKMGRELMSIDEIAVMDGSMCILQIRGERPFLSKKYNIEGHKNYKLLSDADSNRHLDIEKFLSTDIEEQEFEKDDWLVVQPSILEKRSYTRREKKTPTFASVNELIEAKEHEISAIQAEIEQLTAKRNELFFLESQEMGLINVISDPDKAKWLAGVVKESAHMKRQQ